MIAQPMKKKAKNSIHRGPNLSNKGPITIEKSPPEIVPMDIAPANVARDHSNSAVMGLRNTPRTGLKEAVCAIVTMAMVITIIHP